MDPRGVQDAHIGCQLAYLKGIRWARRIIQSEWHNLIRNNPK
jgi:hypothetical protein